MCLVSVNKGRFSQCVCVVVCVCVSAAVLQSVDDLLQDVGASVSDLLQDLVGVFLELRPLPLAQRQLRLQLGRTHAQERNTQTQRDVTQTTSLQLVSHLVQVWFVLDFKGPAINPFVTSLSAHFLKHMFFFSADFLKKRRDTFVFSKN